MSPRPITTRPWSCLRRSPGAPLWWRPPRCRVAYRLREAAQTAALRSVIDAGDGRDLGNDALRQRNATRWVCAWVALRSSPRHATASFSSSSSARSPSCRELLLLHGALEVIHVLHANPCAAVHHLRPDPGMRISRGWRAVLQPKRFELLDPAVVPQRAAFPPFSCRCRDLLSCATSPGGVPGVGLETVHCRLVRADPERLRVTLVEQGQLFELRQHVQRVAFRGTHARSVSLILPAWQRRRRPSRSTCAVERCRSRTRARSTSRKRM